MVLHAPTNGLSIVAVVGVGILAWYVYQIGSRKKERIRYKIRRAIVGRIVYIVAAVTPPSSWPIAPARPGGRFRFAPIKIVG